MEMAADIHKDNSQMEMNASKCIQPQLCRWLFNFDRVKMFCMIWYARVSQLCAAWVSRVIWMQTFRMHTPFGPAPFLPSLLDSLAIMLSSGWGVGGGVDASNHLSYQLCAKQRTH